MFGGNSNWRGPVWRPVNGLLIRGLLNLYQFYGDDFKVECPTGSGTYMTLFEVAKELAKRLSNIFLRDSNGERPVHRDEVPGGPVLEGLRPFLRILPWRQRRRSWRKPSNRFDRHYRQDTRSFCLNPEDALRVSKDELAARMTREHVAGALTSRSTAEWFGIVGLDL